jgi:hypothetical protein
MLGRGSWGLFWVRVDAAWDTPVTYHLTIRVFVCGFPNWDVLIIITCIGQMIYEE